MVDVVVGGSVLDVAPELALASLASRACFLNYSSTITTRSRKGICVSDGSRQWLALGILSPDVRWKFLGSKGDG